MGWGELHSGRASTNGGASGTSRLSCKHGKPCNRAGLRCHHNFPSFANLPGENEVRFDYYTEHRGSRLLPSRHWCLVGEVEHVVYGIRWRVQIKTRFGERVIVHFHLDLEDEESKKPRFFGWSDIKQGTTLCILYAQVHDFLDMTQGIRQEYDSGVMVFPASQDMLADEIDTILATVAAPQECVICHQQCLARKCGTCKVPQYCGAECQRQHWSAGHKLLCGHAAMLANLCRFDFSTFADFQDWNFNVTPMRVEEMLASSSCALEEFFNLRSSQPPVRPSDPLSDLRRLLGVIGEKLLLSDSITAPILKTFPRLMMEMIPGFRQTVKEIFLYHSLMELCDLVLKDPRKRTHVVDMSGGLDDHRNQECLLHALLLALPQWQYDEGIRGSIAWSMEAHTHARMFFKSMYECDEKTKEMWGTSHSGSTDIEMYSVNHKTCDIAATWSDDTRAVARVGITVADKQKESTIVLRVLRATGNQSRRAMIRELALMETPSNVYTLWIREDISSCGKFSKPLNKEHTLVQQLLDSHPFNGRLERLERLRFFRPEGGVAKAKSSPNVMVECSVCRKCDGEVAFTKTQQKKAPPRRKCVFCTRAKQKVC
eukprot:GEMP01012576.1.p1 GENE.GEMP01012576.1~~GEMP01012576.1.p1  ORF type:complete len:599 (+),score=98.08 GEMP01012576.1:54-1850(+)